MGLSRQFIAVPHAAALETSEAKRWVSRVVRADGAWAFGELAEADQASLDMASLGVASEGQTHTIAAFVFDSDFGAIVAASPDVVRAIRLTGRFYDDGAPGSSTLYEAIGEQSGDGSRRRKESAALEEWVRDATGHELAATEIEEILGDGHSDVPPEEALATFFAKAAIGDLTPILWGDTAFDFVHPATDGKRFIAALRDGFIGVWDTASGVEAPLARFPVAPDGWVSAVAEATTKNDA